MKDAIIFRCFLKSKNILLTLFDAIIGKKYLFKIKNCSEN